MYSVISAYVQTHYILLQLFNTTIESSEKGSDLEERLQILLKTTTMTIYENVARGERPGQLVLTFSSFALFT